MESMMDVILNFYDIIGEVILCAFSLLLYLIILLPIIILSVVALCFTMIISFYLLAKLADFAVWTCRACRRKAEK